MVRRKKSPTQQVEAYKRFAGMTLVGAGLIALASLDTSSYAHKRVEKGSDGKIDAVKTTFAVETSGRNFAMTGGDGPAQLAPTTNVIAAPASASPLAAPQGVGSRKPPPGDPAEKAGVRFESPAGAAPAQPTAEQAARLIEDSRARSGSVGQGD